MITDPPPRFDLVEQPWIPCTMLDGSVTELSLREVFERSRQVRRISGELPTQDYALLRVLLVIFWRAHRDDPGLVGPGSDVEEWWQDAFDAAGGETQVQRIRAYLEQWRHRFDLFDAAVPFMQVADLHTKKGEHGSVRRLLADAESDYLSVRAGASFDALGFAEAARWLVHVQAWDYSGIKSGAEGDPRVKGGKGYPIGTGWAGSTGGVVLHGRTLAETLVLNTAPHAVIADREEGDLPAWEQEPHTAAPRGVEFPTGPCDVLTWQSRRVRLFPDGDLVTGVLVSNGDRIETKNQFADPMTAYRYSRNQSSKALTVHMPQQHDAARTLWRGLTPLLVREGVLDEAPRELHPKSPATISWLHTARDYRALPADLLVGVELVGMVYGTQNSSVADAVHETLTIRLGTLMSKGVGTVKAIIDAGRATTDAAVDLGRYAGRLLQATGGEYAFQPYRTEGILHRLDAPFKDWLSAIDENRDPVAQRGRWFSLVEQVVLEEAAILQRGAGPKAVLGRMVQDAKGKPHLISSATAEGALRADLRQHLPREALPGATAATDTPTEGKNQ